MTTFEVMPLSERSSWQDRQRARERNESSYETTCTYQNLPEGAWRASESAVLVSATDVDVLAAWLDVQGGTVTRTELSGGQTVWTLHTTTWSDSLTSFPLVPVHVSVVLPSDEPVMWEITQAVIAA
ncbi:hypothetical protein [Streptomyces sp. NPDC004376]